MMHGSLVRINLEHSQRGADDQLRELVEILESVYDVTITSSLDSAIGNRRASVEFCITNKVQP